MIQVTCNLCGAVVPDNQLDQARHVLENHPMELLQKPSVQRILSMMIHGSERAGEIVGGGLKSVVDSFLGNLTPKEKEVMNDRFSGGFESSKGRKE